MAETADNIYGLLYRGVKEIKGSLLFLEGVSDVGYDETVTVRAPDGTDRMGRVLDVSRDLTVVQVLGEMTGLKTDIVVNF